MGSLPSVPMLLHVAVRVVLGQEHSRTSPGHSVRNVGISHCQNALSLVAAVVRVADFLIEDFAQGWVVTARRVSTLEQFAAVPMIPNG